MLPNPYRDLPASAFWRRAVAIDPMQVDPVIQTRFSISATDKVSTAGSCFAQHISRTLKASGFNYFVTEDGPENAGYGVFPARFGNIYSVRQLHQLFRRAYGLFAPSDVAWVRPDGRLVDPFRPQVEPEGYTTLEDLEADRARHLSAVRTMFEECDVFIFTLGLTECWEATDGAIFPLAPGVVASPHSGDYRFRNMSVAEMTDDMLSFLDDLSVVNPGVKILLTVSPVPLIATYDDRHVLVSTIASKSALRVVADEITRSKPSVDYFPSYEIITGHHHGYRFFEADLRSVAPDGVAHVMNVFGRHYLLGSRTPESRAQQDQPSPAKKQMGRRLDEIAAVICDEEAIER